MWFILNATSIKVNWINSSETNGYVIEYTTGSTTRNVVSTSEDEIVLTDLSSMSTYTISVYSYIDLPSVNSTVTVLRFDGKLLSLSECYRYLFQFLVQSLVSQYLMSQPLVL